MEIKELQEYLKKENLLKQTSQRIFFSKKKEDLKLINSFLQKNSNIPLEELKFLILHSIYEIPSCPVCNKDRKFYKKKFLKTCGNSECFTRIREFTYFQKTGFKNPSQNPEIKKEKEETCFQHYGVLHPLQSRKVYEEMFQKNLKKYGTGYTAQLEDVKKKAKESYFQKTGFLSPMQNPVVLEKRVKEYKKKTGYDFPMQDPETKKKSINTCLKKYGVENVSQSSITANKERKYKYNNLYFDSTHELAFYIKKLEEGCKIEREPFTITYYEDEKDLEPGRRRFYKPDFRIDGKLVEIKGDQFFDKTGSPYDSMNHKTWWGKFYKMKELNVECIRTSTLNSLIKEIKLQKGANFFKECRVY